jgi:hypothetical protein
MKETVMTEKKYNIDLHETTTTGKVMRTILGIICLAVAGWFIFSIKGTAASITTAWIAIIFLFLFGVWLVASGLRYTDRYITVGDDRITLRHNVLRSPVVITAASLKHIEFRPLAIYFCTMDDKVTLKLGAYYPDHSAVIMKAVEDFCISNGVVIKDSTAGENKGDDEA